MRVLLLSKPEVQLAEIVLRNALTVHDDDTLEELIQFFDSNDFYGVPVVDDRKEWCCAKTFGKHRASDCMSSIWRHKVLLGERSFERCLYG